MLEPTITNLTSYVIVNSYIRIAVDKDLSLIHIIWQRQATTEELRVGFYMAIELAILYNCKYWLSDARKTTYLELSDQLFLVRELVSLISSSKIEKVARIVSEDELSLLTAQSIKSKIEAKHKANINFATEIFTDEDVAELWLFSK